MNEDKLQRAFDAYVRASRAVYAIIYRLKSGSTSEKLECALEVAECRKANALRAIDNLIR